MTWLTNPWRFGGSSGVGAADHWRFKVAGQLDRWTRFDAIAMADSPGGPNLCTGETAIYGKGAQTETWSVNSPFAADGIDTRIIGDHLQLERWFGCQFATPKTIVAFSITADNESSGLRPSTPNGLLIERSQDGGTTWVGMAVYAGAGLVQGETRTFSVPTTPLPTGRANAHFRRVRVTSNNGDGYLEIIGIELRSSIGGTNQFTGGASCASASDAWGIGNGSPYAAFDGNTGTWWGLGGAGASMNAWLSYALSTPPTPAQLAIRARGGGSAPKDFVLEWSNDLVNWTAELTVTGETGWGTEEQRVWTIP